MNTAQFYQIAPRTVGLERLDITGISDDWSNARDLVQRDLFALDQAVFAVTPTTRVRAGSNRGGGAHLFVYRVYEPAMESGIDPVVAGVLVRPALRAPADHFIVSGDIAGESLGDILFEAEPREVIGWTAMTEATRDTSLALVGQAAAVSAALRDTFRKE